MTNQHLQSNDETQINPTSDRRRSFLKGLASIPAFSAFSALMVSKHASAADQDSTKLNGSVYNLKGHYFEACSTL